MREKYLVGQVYQLVGAGEYKGEVVGRFVVQEINAVNQACGGVIETDPEGQPYVIYLSSGTRDSENIGKLLEVWSPAILRRAVELGRSIYKEKN